jgi:hypothetical protein
MAKFALFIVGLCLISNGSDGWGVVCLILAVIG